MDAQAANPPAVSGKIQPCSDAGLANFLADVPDETERNNAIAALSHLMQAQPDGFGAHLAAALLAHAHVIRASSQRVEKAIQEGSPEAIQKTLAAVERSVARHPKWNFALNLSGQIIPAVMGVLLGGWIVGALWYVKHQARTRTTEYMLERTLETIHSGMDYDVADGGRLVTIKVLNPAKLHPKQPSNWIPLNAYSDAEGNAVVQFVAPH